MSTPVYDVALSFAGEDRSFASALAVALEDSDYAVFYDAFEGATLWGTELPLSLGQIYGHDSRFCIIVVSESYARKPWTNHERRFAIQRALTDRTDYILPIRLDDTQLPGWPSTVAYLDARETPVPEIVSNTLAKLGVPVADRSASLATVDVNVVEEMISACFRRALFTRMDSEIDLGEMNASLRECLGSVQRLVPRLRTPELQHVGLRLIQTLDEIQRLSASQLREHGARGSRAWSFAVPDNLKVALDGLKLEAVQLLRRLRRRSGARAMLPTALGYDHFHGVDQGREPPTMTGQEPGALGVDEHISHVEQEQRERRHVVLDVSPLGEACIAAYNVLKGVRRDLSEQDAMATVMDHIRSERIQGPHGDEAVYCKVVKFGTPLGGDAFLGSGAMVGMVVCRPGLGEQAFAVVFDEKWPEYLGLFYRQFSSPGDAEAATRDLAALEGWPVKRGEALGSELVSRGWQHLEGSP